MEKIHTNRMYTSEISVISEKNRNQSLVEILMGCGASVDKYGFKMMFWKNNEPTNLLEVSEESVYGYLSIPFIPQDQFRFDMERIKNGKDVSIFMDFSIGNNPLTNSQTRWIMHVLMHLLMDKEVPLSLTELKWKLITFERFERGPLVI